jgi:hypothetical protein
MVNKEYSNTRFWDKRRGVIRTCKGGWVIGKDANFHGFSLLKDLLGHASFFQVMILNVTGKLPELRLAKWFEATFLCVSWPDPRIWCNQIGTLGGTTRTTPVAAVCAGTLAGDSRIYGQGTVLSSTKFITSALVKKNKGYSVKKIIEEQRKGLGKKLEVPGYSRPIAIGDERVEAMERVTKELGYPLGPHLSLAYEIHDYLNINYDESMNLAGYMFAFLSDQGFSADEIYRICSLLVCGGIFACYSEAADREPESFLPLRCDDVEYCGVPEREIPAK